MYRRSIGLAKSDNDNPCMRGMKQRHCMVEITIGSENCRAKPLGGGKNRLIIRPQTADIRQRDSFMPT